MNHRHSFLMFGVVFASVFGIYYFAPSKHYSENVQAEKDFFVSEKVILPETKKSVRHVKTPESVKAIYMTSWVAGTPSLRERIIKIIKETEINSVIIDIKDDTGKISFLIDKEPFKTLGSSENRISDIRELIEELHENNIYVIGRIATFQDPYLIKKWPEEAVKTETNKDKLWKDRKGLGWFDAGSEKVWDYVITLAKESHEIGFDEINFDYIRFPSDGNMQDIYFPMSEDKDKSVVLESFFKYLNKNLKTENSEMVISADIFGMTTTNTDDLGIGQVLEKTIPYFDYVCPMVYPSHFPNNWYGIKNPAENPYEVIKISMAKAVERVKLMGEDPQKLRPWLQDFNLGAIYTKELVRDQITATYDVGLNSWLMWDPKNIYTSSAFLPEE